MRIGIDFHSAEKEGSGNCTYIRNLVEALVELQQENEYFLYVNNIRYPYYARFNKYKHVHFRQIGIRNPFIRIPILGIMTFFDKIDVLHVQYIAPPVHRGKLVVMIHDLAFIHFDYCFSKFERIRSKILIPFNARIADKILTVSDYSKQDIVKTLKIPAEKIVVTYDAVDGTFKQYSDMKQISSMLSSYGINDKYILSVGRLDPRKNLARLIEAFVKLKKEKSIPHKLVIAGKKDYLSSTIEKLIQNEKNNIIPTNYIPSESLPFFYCGADVFVYPTLFEGFGLPCLEAMSCGCPVVSSKTSSIPEVVGQAGILVDPYSVNEIADAIYKVISYMSIRSEMKRKGLLKALEFNWKETAMKTLETYKTLC